MNTETNRSMPWVVLVVLSLMFGCSNGSTSASDSNDEMNREDTASGSDTDTDADTDADTDSDTDADTDSDTDADTDSDTDADSDTAPDSGWELVWSDEFEGSEIDMEKWEHEVNCWGGGNNELQCYVADSKNAYVADGMLHLVAIADSPSGEVNPPNDTNITTMPYSSARLRTKNRGDWTYGRIEARLMLPDQQGLWPAFWMLPTDSNYGGWAASGEIDIMEAVNLSPEANTVHGTLHYGGEWPDNVSSGEAYTPSAYVAENFFTYAVEWEEGEIRWYVDDVHYATQNDWYTNSGDPFPAPFNQSFHILLNVAVGGNWPGAPDDSTTFPKEMLVDYVRVYQCAADPATGRGCATN